MTFRLPGNCWEVGCKRNTVKGVQVGLNAVVMVFCLLLFFYVRGNCYIFCVLFVLFLILALPVCKSTDEDYVVN